MGEPMLYRSITFTNGVISLDQDQTTCAPKLIIWPPSICYLVSGPKKVNERMLTMMALMGCFWGIWSGPALSVICAVYVFVWQR